jgi:hypothetical protein
LLRCRTQCTGLSAIPVHATSSLRVVPVLRAYPDRRGIYYLANAMVRSTNALGYVHNLGALKTSYKCAQRVFPPGAMRAIAASPDE